MSATHRVATFLVWLWRFTKGWLPQALATAATIFSIIWGSYGEKIWTNGSWAIICAVTLGMASLAAQVAVQRPSYMELSRRKEEADEKSKEKSKAIEQSFNVLLRKLAEHCKAASNSDRASVYYFHDDRFIMLARWSTHPTFTKPGRREYPTGQGAIGDAWDKGSVVMVLPATRKRWEQRLESHHGFPGGSTKSLTMHCKSIAALRIEADYHAVGVLVFESTDVNRASQKTLDIAMGSMLYATLCELVSAVAALTPRVEEVVEAAAQKPSASIPNWKPATTP
jgi:transcriptional regulator with GAF, ATPase, and Fis domain